jgi:hypothetical protein
MDVLPLRLVNSMHWELLTCPWHRAGAIVIRQRDGLTAVRCRECAREAETTEEEPEF